jgi:hypothetical protein
MKSSLAVIPVLCIAALSAGCGGGAEASKEAPRAAESVPATQAAKAATGGSEFGVPECDSYVKKYLACVDSKVPESARAMLRQSFDATKAQWKQAASTPQGRAGLASGCLQADAAAKQSMAVYGCTW